jgi:hypothetical protein
VASSPGRRLAARNTSQAASAAFRLSALPKRGSWLHRATRHPPPRWPPTMATPDGRSGKTHGQARWRFRGFFSNVLTSFPGDIRGYAPPSSDPSAVCCSRESETTPSFVVRSPRIDVRYPVVFPPGRSLARGRHQALGRLSVVVARTALVDDERLTSAGARCIEVGSLLICKARDRARGARVHSAPPR